jgi:hypothetical protein
MFESGNSITRYFVTEGRLVWGPVYRMKDLYFES